jgi:PAS domain S-box-containing protein
MSGRPVCYTLNGTSNETRKRPVGMKKTLSGHIPCDTDAVDGPGPRVPAQPPSFGRLAGPDLAEGGKLLQTIIETEPECVKLVAADGTLIMMNRAGLDMIQASSLARVQGKSIYPLITPEYRTAFEKLTAAVFLGKPGTLTFEMVGVKGRRLWLETHAVPLRNDKDEIIALLGITRDITERKKAEATILEQKRFAENLVTSSAVATFVLNPRHKVVLWNRACEELTGKSSIEMIGTEDHWKPFYRRKHPTLADLVIDGAVEEGASHYTSCAPSAFVPNGVQAEGWYPELNGKDRYLTFDAAPVYDSAGNLSVVIQTINDVTERKKTEESLKQERDFTSAVLDTVGSMVLVLDRGGGIIRFNRTCEEVSGYAFEEVRGRHVWDFLIPPEGVEESRRTFGKLTSGALPAKYENYWTARDGRRKLISWSDTALYAPDGSVEYVIPTGIDITEHRKAEGALLEEKKFSDAIIHSLPGTFTICDERGALIRWNDNLKKVSGYGDEELSRMNVLDLYREDRELLARKMSEALDAGTASAEAGIMTRTGARIPFLLTGFRMVMNDNRYVVGVGIDVSERKRLEDQLRHSQKMESIGTLAGGIAHDFNNILTAIIGYGNLLQLKMRRDDPLRHNVEQILASANRAAGLTRGLLAYSRKQVLNPQRTDLNDIIRKVERLLLRLIGEDVELKPMLAEKELPVMADAGQIEQVLMNLATNARDAMPGGGYLFIETDAVELDEVSAKALDLRAPGTYAVVTVTDSGAGIDEKTRERIFEPFFTTKEVGRGTGLGLAMTYGIVKQHNGAIAVQSTEGEGATFRIYLPIVEAGPREVQPAALSPIKGGVETVPVAEDDATVRNLTCNMLEQFGYTVLQAEDGEDAVNKFMENRGRVDLLLLDVIMPKKSGREVYEKIKIFKPDVKALFTSGYTADIISEKGLLGEKLPFIIKPAPLNDILRKVREILDGK